MNKAAKKDRRDTVFSIHLPSPATLFVCARSLPPSMLSPDRYKFNVLKKTKTGRVKIKLACTNTTNYSQRGGTMAWEVERQRRNPHRFGANPPPPLTASTLNTPTKTRSKITRLFGRDIVAIDLQSTCVRKIKFPWVPLIFNFQETLCLSAVSRNKKSCAIGCACLAVAHDVHPNLAEVNGLVALLEGHFLRILQQKKMQEKIRPNSVDSNQRCCGVIPRGKDCAGDVPPD